MTDYESYGREIGALVVARLDGRLSIPREVASSPMVINWHALKKWHVPESRVPAEAIVRFKPPSLWQEHRGVIIGILVVVAMQSALIAGLLINRATRRRAERALAESTERMSLAADAANLGYVGVGRFRRRCVDDGAGPCPVRLQTGRADRLRGRSRSGASRGSRGARSCPEASAGNAGRIRNGLSRADAGGEASAGSARAVGAWARQTAKARNCSASRWM